MDAINAMRLFHESPELSLHELSLPFLDARKRIASLPQIEHWIRLVAVPTTAGTGSEVSPAAVVSIDNKKVTLVDYSLVPDVAVVDPTLTLSMPLEITADTGIDALTHAPAAAVSIFASPYTDAFCMQAVNLILDAPARAYHDGSDLKARSAMANAATNFRLAFSNAFVGLNHALAHALGAASASPTAAPTRFPAPRPALTRSNSCSRRTDSELAADAEDPGACRTSGARPRRHSRTASCASFKLIEARKRNRAPDRRHPEPQSVHR